MDIETIVSVVKNPKSPEISLLKALTIIRHRIEYYNQRNINVLSDPLLAKVLYWK